MPINSLSELLNAGRNGESFDAHFYKTSLPNGAAGDWLDLSMGAGIPKYNAYVGGQLEATPYIGSANNGVYLGANPPEGKSRYVSAYQFNCGVAAAMPALFLPCDYLMAYPLVDGDSTDLQEMDNTQTLPRYQDGFGVQCFAVVTTPMAANTILTITYTNSDGVSGRTITASLIASSVTGVIASSQGQTGLGKSPFFPLASGDKGIRQIDSVQLSTGAGGFFALVLVRPLDYVQMVEAVAAEIDTIPMLAKSTEIKQGAYINFLCNKATTTALQPLSGFIETIWQ